MKQVYLAVSSDVLHEGIINIISEAAKLGELTIGLLSDEAIATYKRMPLLDYASREKVYAALQNVSRVVPQKTLSYRENLEALRPDIVVHGDDWVSGPQSTIRQEVIECLSEWGGELKEFPYTSGISATSLERDLRAFMGSPDSRRASLKKMLALKPYLRVIESSNGLSALIAENASFEDKEKGEIRKFDGLWVSSLCDSTFKGKPDIELVDFTSRLNTIQEIMDVSSKPIILDGDTGGKLEHFVTHVKTLERVGVSAVIVEDKRGLKQNSLFGTERLQELEDPHAFAEKLAAGKRAQRTRDFMIFARIESLIAGLPVSDACERADIYLAEGGADGIMIHSKDKNPASIYEFLKSFKANAPDVPVIVVPTSYNQVKEAELAEAGANIIIYANHLLRASYLAMNDVAHSILQNERSLEADEKCLPIKDVLSLIPEE